MRYTHQVCSLHTHTKEDWGPSGCDCPMGVPKRLQMRDTCTKSAGVGNHRRVTGGSVGAPRIPEMRGTHQVRSLHTKQAGLGAHCRVTVCSMKSSRKPKMRYMQQVRSLRIKTSGHRWVNKYFKEAQMRYKHQVRSLRTKKWSHIWVNGCPQEAKKQIHAPSRSLRTKTKGHGWVNGCAQDAQKGIWRRPRDPSDPRKAKRKNFERHKTITAKAPQSEAQKEGGVGSRFEPVSVTLNAVKR